MTIIPIDTSYLIPGQPIDASDVTIPLKGLQDALEDIVDGNYNFLKTVYQVAIPALVVANAFTPTQSILLVAPNAGTTATLQTINHPGVTTPDRLILFLGNPAHTITIKHNVGNILFDDQLDIVLNSTNIAVVLIWNATTSKWVGSNQRHGSVWMFDAASVGIVADVATIQQSVVKLVPEVGTSDSLFSIVNPLNVGMIFLRVNGASDSVTLVHGTGNIWLDSEANYTITPNSDVVPLVWNSTTGYWNNLNYTGFTTFNYQSIGATGLISGVVNGVRGNYSQFMKRYLPMTTPNGGLVLENGVVEDLFLPRLAVKSWAATWVNGNGSNFATVGMGTPAATAASQALQDTPSGQNVRMTSTTTLGNLVIYRSPSSQFRLDRGLTFECQNKPMPLLSHVAMAFQASQGLMAGTPVHPATFAGVSGMWFQWTTITKPIPGGGTQTNYTVNVLVYQAGTLIHTMGGFSTNGMFAGNNYQPGDVRWIDLDTIRYRLWFDPATLRCTAYVDGIIAGQVVAHFEASQILGSIAGLLTTGLDVFAAHWCGTGGIPGYFDLTSIYAEGF